MALQKLAPIGVRPRCTWQIAVVSVAVLTVAGCSHNRQSYRPIFASPVPVTKPCTNCGGSSASVIEEPTGGGTVSSVPSLVDTPISDTPAASSTAPSGGGSGTVRSSTVEKPPKARLEDEPGLNENLSPAPASGLGGGTTPPSPPKPLGSGAASGPTLLGPTSSASPAAWDADAQEAVQTSATAPSRVRRASSTERLKPFVDESNANELIYPNKADRPWRYIVLHHSASATGNYDQIDSEHRKVLGIDGCGYHFVIGNGTGSKDGQIEVSQRWNNQKQGAHTRNARTHDADEYGIGICLVGDFDQQPPSARQIAATQALITYLSKRYNIASSNVRSHAHLAATKTVCPGRYFPSEAMLNVTKDAQADRPVRATWKVVRDTTQR
jgi:N-acetyl-anhydromuramyl-L-alanine amidase AmpD